MGAACTSVRQRPGFRTGVSALAVVVLATAGCGGGSGHRTQSSALGTPFQNRAAAVCRAAFAQKKAHGPFPFPNFNPTRPDRSKLPAIGRLDAQTARIFRTWLRGWVALG